MGNKIKYNLKNVHAAKLTRGEDGSFTYAKPKAIPGAVSISLDAEGDSSPFYADGIVYFRSTANNGYSGDLEIALIPEWFRTEILKEELDSNGVLIERADITELEKFALLFEFDGDVRSIRHVLYNCSATRPGLTSATTTNTKEPSTETVTLTASPLSNGYVKAKTTPDTPEARYNGWYQQVWQPLPKLEVTSQAGQTLGQTKLSVMPAKAAANSYKYQTGASVSMPAYDADCSSGYTDWDGSEEVAAENGHQIVVVETTAEGKARAGGMATVTAKTE